MVCKHMRGSLLCAKLRTAEQRDEGHRVKRIACRLCLPVPKFTEPITRQTPIDDGFRIVYQTVPNPEKTCCISHQDALSRNCDKLTALYH